MAAMVVGNTQLRATATAAIQRQVRAGRVRPLAVSSVESLTIRRQVPSVAEVGIPGYEVDGGYAVLARGRMPKRLVERIYAVVVNALTRHTRGKIRIRRVLANGVFPNDFSKIIERDLRK